MSTWTSRLVLKLAPALALSACVAGGIGLPGASRSTRILDGTFSVGVPRGYCVDPTASQTGPDSAVMLIGRCDDGTDVVPAAITATIGEAGSAAVMQAGTPALSAYFTSDEGRAALSRDGDAAAVAVQEIRTSEGVLILHLTDRAVGEYWRAVTGLGGRLVTLSVTPPGDQPLTPAEGKALLDKAVAAMVAANPAPAT